MSLSATFTHILTIFLDRHLIFSRQHVPVLDLVLGKEGRQRKVNFNELFPFFFFSRYPPAPYSLTWGVPLSYDINTAVVSTDVQLSCKHWLMKKLPNYLTLQDTSINENQPSSCDNYHALLISMSFRDYYSHLFSCYCLLSTGKETVLKAVHYLIPCV